MVALEHVVHCYRYAFVAPHLACEQGMRYAFHLIYFEMFLHFDCYHCEMRFSSLFFVVRLDDHRHVGRLLRCKPLLLQ